MDGHMWDRDRRFLTIDIRKDIAATLQNVYNNVMLEWCKWFPSVPSGWDKGTVSSARVNLSQGWAPTPETMIHA